MNEIKANDVKQSEKKYEHRTLIRMSYGTREMFGQFITAAFGFNVLFYYEGVIGLSPILIAIAFTFYSIWNAINDPLIGWIMERIHMPWEKKSGFRRLPWMIIGAIPWLFSYILVYTIPFGLDPNTNPTHQLPVFFWYLFTICLYDTLLTLYDVNVISLYPVKFKGLNERRNVQGYGTILGILGLVLAVILPSAFIDQDIASTYITASWVSVGIGLIFFILILPGVWETKKIKDMNKERGRMEAHKDIDSFFKETGKAVRNRRFMMKVIFFWGYQVAGVMIQNSARYIIAYTLGFSGNEADFAFILLLGGMLLGALISIPIWTILSQRSNNNKRISIFAGFVMFVTFIPMIFVNGLIAWTISLIFFGVGLGGQWFTDPPTMGDVLDDIAVKTGKRQQSIYYGFQALFIRLGYATIVITIALVHIFTGFVEGAPTLAQQIAASPTPELAIFGVRIHSAIIPAIIVLITIILFWKFYDLTPEVVEENKKKLEELNI
jgi:GPH family glycoside/pentoside/hexuronide:cation symporter